MHFGVSSRHLLGGNPTPEMTILPAGDGRKFFSTFVVLDWRMKVIGQCVVISVCRSVSFCNKIKVASCICVSAKLVRMRIIAVAAPWLQSVLESRLTYFMTVK